MTGYRIDMFLDSNKEVARLAQQVEAAIDREIVAYRAAGMSPGSRVLDVGCGPGFVSAALRSHGHDVVGVDLSRELLAYAAPPRACARITALPFADGTFDATFARLVTQHLDAPVAAIREMARVTRPGGAVVLVDGDESSIAYAPSPRGFEEARARRVAWARSGGLEPDAGRNLKRWLVEAGLHPGAAQFVRLDSEALGRETFASIAFQPYYRAAGVDPADALAEWSADPGAFGFAHLLVVGGARG